MTPADRELLELAARAAGLENPQYWEAMDSGGFRGFYGIKQGTVGHLDLWNPLEDDGDALRLAVKLRMFFHVEDYGASARVGMQGTWYGCESHINGGIEAATRRAIVRAAAAIGETL